MIGFSHEISQKYIKVLLDSLRHRGPDGEGIIEDQHAVLGHRRLSIIDIDGGKQPMVSADGNFIITFNGEIYNYKELYREIAEKGIFLKTNSDTEVLLELFASEGCNCLKKINGMFAFAIWNRKKKELFAARDHFGIKPFYYSISGDKFVFASELKALLKAPGSDCIINLCALKHYLVFQFFTGNETFVKDIFRLEPASYLIFNEDGLFTQKYWTPVVATDFAHSENEFVEKLSELLYDSVSFNLRSDVPIASYLSGGLDSSIISILANEITGRGPECFCGKFMEEGYDESVYAGAVASKINTELNVITISSEDFIRSVERVSFSIDEPLAGPGSFPQYIVSSNVSKKYKVVLGGQGGDEIFGGYIRYLVAYFEQAIKGSILETQEEGNHIVTLRTIVDNLPQLRMYLPMIRKFWSSGLFQPMESRYFDLIRRDSGILSVLKPEFGELLEEDALRNEFSEHFMKPLTPSYLNKMMIFDVNMSLPALLQIEDRVSMAHSLECRVPFLDYRLFDFMCSVPPAIKFKGGKTKCILRKAMEHKLPDEVRLRKDKAGFPVPLGKWLKNDDFRDFIKDILLSDRAKCRGFHSVSKVEQMLETEGEFDRRLWAVLSLELWQRNFVDKLSCTG